jgi:tetratricopeptide (TPR) repeat protein
MELGDYDTADAVLAEAADLERKLDPRDERLRLEIAMTKAAILQQRGDLEAAERALRDVLAERERVLGPDHEDALITTGSLGNVIASRGRPLEAEPLLTRAFEGLETLHGSDHPHTILARGGLIALAYDRGDYERAIALAAAGVDAARRVLGSDNTHFLEELNTYAVLLDESGRSAQAVELGREIVERGSRQLHADHEQLLRWRFNYALFLYGSEAFAEATSTAADVLERRRRVLGREHEQSIETGKLCVRCWLRLKDWGRVIEETSVLLGEAGAPDARLDFLYSRSLALAKSGRRDEAIAAARDTLELLEELGAGMPSDGRHYLQQLALLLDDAGAVEEAARARSSLRELPAAR